MAISTLPPAPARTDAPSVFVPKADAFLGALQTFGTEANALAVDVNAKQVIASNASTSASNSAASALASKNSAADSAASAILAPGSNGTSTTSLSVASGNISLTTQTGKAFVVGSWVNITRTSDVSKSMLGQISSYNSGTGAMVVSVAAANIQGVGSGPYTDWSISQSSMPGNVITAVELSNVGPSIKPSLLCDFANSKRLDSRFVYAMSSQQTYFDSVGNLKTSEANMPTFDHDPITGKCLGISIWESRTNTIRNNNMQGGSAGVSPTNWNINAAPGITATVVGVGTEYNIKYIDIRWNGTAASGNVYTIFDTGLVAAATAGQTHTLSAYVRQIAGSMSGLTSPSLVIDEFTSGGAFVTSGSGSVALSNGPLNTYRPSLSRTISGGTTAFIKGYFQILIGAGGAIDITVRIGLPQLEQGAFATPIIITTGSTNNRSAPTLTMATSSFDFNPAEGTMYVEGDYGQVSVDSPTMARFDDNSEGNRIMLRVGATTQRMSVVTSGTVVADISLTSPVVGVATKVVGAYKADDFAVTKDGASTSSDNSGALPLITTLKLGQDGLASNYLNGHISKFAYFPKRLPNNELVAMSTL